MQAWFPATSSLPSSVSHPHRLVESQTCGAIWAFLWSDCVLLSMLPNNTATVINSSSSSSSGTSTTTATTGTTTIGSSGYSSTIEYPLDSLGLRPIAVCAFHLLLAELLHSQQLLIASGYLQQATALYLPGFPASLEFLLHYALNCGDSTFLSATLQLLSQLPFFSHILVRCLRKQERSMWPFAVQNAEDIQSLYLEFLFNNDMEYAVTTISILQGLLCSVGNAWNAATQSPLQIETWKQALRGSEEWLIDDYSEVFCCNVEGECVAHLSGLQLLFVAIIRGEYALLADIYRFLLMEVRMGREFYVGSASRRDGEADSRGLFGVARAERDCGAIVVQRTHGIAGAFAQKRGIRVGHGHASRGRQLCGQSGGFDAREWLADGAAGRRAGESSDERVEGRRSRYGVRLARKDDGL